MQKLLGITFRPKSGMRNPWKAQITRCGKSHYLGSFASAEDAARAYDNAAHYLEAWADGTNQTRLNFPKEWEQEIPAPNEMTLKHRTWLREKHPQMELEADQKRELKTSQALELDSAYHIEHITSSARKLQSSLSKSVGRLRYLEARVDGLEKEVEKRDRIIEGLRAQGGQQYFKRVGTETVPATPVESHLA
jgi:hypothetical protein